MLAAFAKTAVIPAAAATRGRACAFALYKSVNEGKMGKNRLGGHCKGRLGPRSRITVILRPGLER